MSLSRGVQFTRELARILAIPRRTWAEDDAVTLARDMTEALRRPGGTMSLRPIQALALYDAGTRNGLFAPIRVGGGKTLLSLLAPFVLDARRPLLLLPAKLIEKTKREARELARHWPIPNFIRIESYELLGRAQSAELLNLYQPDLIIADEAHKLKNAKAAVTKRVARFMAARPHTRFVAMSGTITKRSLKDYAHVIKWCLEPADCPIPHGYTEIEDWADALDEKPHTPTAERVNVGALETLCTDAERSAGVTLDNVRRAFRKRLVETAGVVATTEGHVGCSLTIAPLECDVTPDINDAFRLLRTEWTTPDGWPLSDPLAVWRHARELALGFYYRWDPRPPDDWLAARKAWSKACREILTTNRRSLDSELQVLRAVDEGHYPEAIEALNAWRAVKGAFVPNTVPVWFDESVIDAANTWATREPGIIWCEHTAFAERLSVKARLAYYGKRGQDTRGRPIESAPPSTSLIASLASNAEGRNLQAWNRNLVISCPPNGQQWEQLLGRTHRDGQPADEVTFDVVTTAYEHVSAFWQACADARYIEASTGQSQKLLYADSLMPSPAEMDRPGFRWNK